MPKRILLVDDSNTVRQTVRSFLEKHADWQICGEAVNGLDALHKIRACCPDVIVLDLAMPVMNGLEAAKHLRQIVASVPIVLFTSYDSAQVEREAATIGIATVISKDKPIQGLESTIEKLLSEPSPSVSEYSQQEQRS